MCMKSCLFWFGGAKKISVTANIRHCFLLFCVRIARTVLSDLQPRSTISLCAYTLFEFIHLFMLQHLQCKIQTRLNLTVHFYSCHVHLPRPLRRYPSMRAKHLALHSTYFKRTVRNDQKECHTLASRRSISISVMDCDPLSWSS